MSEIDVFECCYGAKAEFSGVARRAASVKLTATSDAGEISYRASVSFFPHRDDEDFAISYDAYFEKEIYRAKGRRSRKREKGFLAELQTVCDGLAEEAGGKIFWDSPLYSPRLG
ncbi:MAG: hypothetical protein J5919_01055 [Clostridia bacterium]|nr:hypothetical protein [Clostridia bacterium]